METAPPPTLTEGISPVRADQVEHFFDTLRKEQAHFLDTIGRARSLLGHDSGQLAHVSAIQGRLTRQFFDAQRSILARRAEVDAEVAGITREADRRAERIIADALARVDASVPRGATPFGPPLGPPCAAPPVCSVMPATAEMKALATLIDDAFGSDEPDGAVAERQLAAVLDEWWVVENRDGRGLIEDARARAAMRVHVAGLEAMDLIAAAGHRPSVAEAGTAVPQNVLPDAVRAVLDGATEADLEEVLACLGQELSPPDEPALAEPSPSMTPAIDEMIIRLEALAASYPETGEVPVDSRPFWGERTSSRVVDAIRSAVTHAVLPVTAVTSILVLLLVWIG